MNRRTIPLFAQLDAGRTSFSAAWPEVTAEVLELFSRTSRSAPRSRRRPSWAASGFWLPADPRWGNFATAYEPTNFPRAALNSALITVGSVLLTNSMVAYAIARNLHR